MDETSKNACLAQEFIPREEHDKALQKIELLEFEIAQMKRLIFGVKSERFVAAGSPDSQQLDLFNQNQNTESSSQPEQTQQVAYTHTKYLKKISKFQSEQRYQSTYHV